MEVNDPERGDSYTAAFCSEHVDLADDDETICPDCGLRAEQVAR